MKLDKLPNEILTQIFRYLPTFQEVSKVNQLFYWIGCKVNDSNICLRINQQFIDRFLKCNLHFQSILKSNRQITRIQIVGESKSFTTGIEHRVISVVNKFSTTIKHLTITCVTTDESTLFEILALNKNIEHLELNRVHQSIAEGNSMKVRHCNDALSFNKLKSLTMFGSEQFVGILDRLPVGVLTQLQLQCTQTKWHKLTDAVNRQYNVKNLCVNMENDGKFEYGITTNLLDKLKLESLELSGSGINNVFVAVILSGQQQLKSLVLNAPRMVLGERVIKAMNRTDLEKLIINLSPVSVDSIKDIRELKKLHEFHLQIYEIESQALRTLADSDNTSMKKLSISFGTNMWTSRIAQPVSHIAALAKSAPNLIHLKVLSFDGIYYQNREQILRHFNFVEVLKIPINFKPIGDAADYYNPKLIELQFQFNDDDFYTRWLPILIGSYPNLKKLTVKTDHTIIDFDQDSDIRQILDGLPKLEYLIIRADRMTIVESLEYLCDRMGNLKFVSWGYNFKRHQLTNRVLKKLHACFGLVRFNGRILNMAVDRYAMICKPEIDALFV